MPSIADLRQAAVLRLQAVPEFSGVAVLAEDRLDLVTEINKAVATGKGLVVTVATGSEKFRQGANPKPVAEVELVVEVGENPMVNRAPTGARLPASDAAALVVRALHHFPWTPGKVLVASEKVYDKDDKAKIVTYAAIFTTLIDY